MGHPMVVAVAVRLQFIPRKEPLDLLDLPWSTPPAASRGEEAELWFDATRMHLFDPASGENLTRDLLHAATT
jgi:hypothetical protein